MKYNYLGNTKIKVSLICLGTMTWGEQNSEKDGFDQMDFAYDEGINFFDTAELYSVPPRKETWGSTEKIIGKWLKSRKIREKVVIATKVVGRSGMKWFRNKETRLNREQINEAIDGSLKRLQTDYIDLYQLHWPERKVPKFGVLDFKYDPQDHWTPIEEVLENLERLIKAGKIRYVGLSNETPWGVMKFLQLAKERNLPRMVSIQNVYSLVNRVFDVANSEVAIRENCGLLAYSPLAGGRLSGKYIGNNKPKNSRYTIWPKRFSRHHTKRGEIAIELYFNLAKKYGLSPSVLANAFVNDRPFVTSNIIGATTMDQLKENIDSIDITLTKEILHEIEDIHLSDPNPCV